MDEMLFFPFGQHDDLVDATSRIYDIGTTRPRKVTSTDLERYYADA
jgi:phage terminase large subunit-like protein